MSLYYHKGETKEICDSSIMFPAGYYGEKYKHLQQKVDQLLVSAVMRQKILFFCLNIVNEKLAETLAKTTLSSLQSDIKNFIFTSSYRIQRFHM